MDNINEIEVLNKISNELNDLHDRCRDIIQSKNRYSNDTLLLPVLVSRITSLTDLFEEKFNLLFHQNKNLQNSNGSNDSHIHNLTWHRRTQIFSEQLSNYKYLLSKLIKESREVQSFEVASNDTYTKFKNRKFINSNNDFSSLYNTNAELNDTLFQGINTVTLLTTQNKKLNQIKHKVTRLFRLAAISDANIIQIYKYAKMNQKIITFGFAVSIIFLLLIYFYY